MKKSEIVKIINEEILKEWGSKGWKPSRSQAREFANNMKDPEFADAYYGRKKEKEDKRRSTSKFDYNTAGGNYVPTQAQYEFVMNNPSLFTTDEEKDAANMVMYGYTNKEKIQHDFIHIVNEKIRSGVKESKTMKKTELKNFIVEAVSQILKEEGENTYPKEIEYKGYKIEVTEKNTDSVYIKTLDPKGKVVKYRTGRYSDRILVYKRSEARFIEEIESNIDFKLKRKEEMSAERAKKNAVKISDVVEVGDIFYSSWGYEQTNVDFYEVVRIDGKFVFIKEIKKDYKGTGFMSGTSKGLKGQFVDDAEIKTSIMYNSNENKVYGLRMSGNRRDHSGSYLYRWDGRPEYESSYA